MESLGPDDPRTLGSYRLLGRLGAGGMGRVYLARSERGRTVAVKLVHRELAGQEEFRRRFRAEVRAARQVGGEWTAPVLDADTDAEVPWVATGYIAGPSLRRVVDRDFGPLPERSVRVLGAGLARALQAIHAAGVVHRDLKPSNVLITLDGPRVIDFGIARALETVTDAEGLTRTGATVGSPGFMSPEQVRGARVTPASDVFCLGSVLAYATTGRGPFGTDDSGVHAVMYRIAEEEPDLDGVPAGLRPLIAECLAKAPAARPTPARVLERLGTGEPPADSWLPTGLVARLGRHAVQLLNVEEPGPSGEAETAVGTPVPDPTLTAPPTPPTEPPTVTAGPTPAPAYGYPHGGAYGSSPFGTGTQIGYPQRPPRRSRTPILLAAVVAAALLAGGGVVYVLTKGDGARDSVGSPSSPSAPPSTDSTPPSAPGGGPTPDDDKAPGTTPQGFTGTWHSGFTTNAGSSDRTIIIRKGRPAQVVIEGSGVLDDGTPYTCRWTATGTDDGGSATTLHLGSSAVTQAAPTTACQPGSASDLVLLPDGHMRRDFTDSGTRDASLIYTRTG
ncbi:serine/threonine-protein kinase [Streptomyces sp. UNOC14_S4]|uniref:serine/threonine-protein kinase n=1 Tax=Streptomyces sp. UNOC14_S4 TaxID=2872340 RepID=UPI001E3C7A53|nr:serine/threonine-protein kinase [Streptomyces sp. UNOC14_S4]MCC3768793.1 serine/threonine protein kinase [Streptomyces sp. UNOC14_S4]